jgi:hypothetical protein
VFPTGINPNLVRSGGTLSTEQITELLKVGRVLDVEVISVFGERAILSFGRNLRLEVTIQTLLKEGQKVKVQVQPRSDGQVQHGTDARSPVILKLVTVGAGHEGLIYVRIQPTPAPTLPQVQLAGTPSPHTPGSQSAQPGVQTQATPQTQPQAGQPVLSWIPISLPQGGQAWAQIYVQEDGRKPKGPESQEAHHQVKIWWETPGVGPVQVTMDAVDSTLTALFTVVVPETRQPLDQALPLLQERLNLAGFTDTRLGTRQSVQNEMVGPVRLDDSSRLDRRA